MDPNATNSEDQGVIGYCVKCKQKREMTSTEQVTMKTGRPAMKGVCTNCGTGMYKILSPKNV